MVADYAATIRLLHAAHILVWAGRRHRCRVEHCTGLVGDPTDGVDIWITGPPPQYHHGRGRAVDIPPKLPQLMQPKWWWGP